MTLVEVEVLEIKWEGPYKINEIRDKDGAADFGFYQIYGTHNIHGPETLLYIGKAQDRPFSVRIPEHQDWIEWEPSEIKVYLGRLGGTDNMTEERYKEWEEKIDRAERLLIYFSAPPYNSMGLKSYGETKPTVILNFHKRNRLPLEMSTLYESSLIAKDPLWKVYGKE